MQLFLEFISKLHNVSDLIKWGGYAVLAVIIFAETGLFFGFFLPGDSLLVTAGLFAGKGDLNIWMLFFLLSAMAIIGDAVGYWFGRVTGPKIFTREQSLLFDKKHLVRAQFFYEKYGGKTIIFARFIPVIRTFAPIVAGVGNMSYAKFASFNIFGGIAWIASMLGIGYFLGSIIPGIDKKLDIIIPAVIILSILPGVIEYLRHRKDFAKEVDKSVSR
ncbi:MAG: VTT domain-containing protein [Patescibacteria group bacterium]